MPDWTKAQAGKPKIQMKINFKPLPEVQPSDDSDEDLPPVLEDPNPEKKRKNRLFDDPNPLDEPSDTLPGSQAEKEFTDLPTNTVAIPLGDLKAAGSGMTNNSLRKVFRFLEIRTEEGP